MRKGRGGKLGEVHMISRVVSGSLLSRPQGGEKRETGMQRKGTKRAK